MRKLILVAIITLSATSLFGANLYWIATTPSTWNNGASWSSSALGGGSGGAACGCTPGAGDVVFFNGAFVAAAGANATGSVTTLSASTSILGLVINNTYSGTIDLGGFTLTVTDDAAGGNLITSATINSGTLYFNSVSGVATTFTGGTYSANLTFNGSLATISVTFDGGTYGGNVNITYTQGSGSTEIFTVKNNATFNGSFSGSAPIVQLNGGTFNGATDISKTGGGASTSNGGNTFNNTTSISSNSSNGLFLANVSGDIFAGATTFQQVISTAVLVIGKTGTTKISGDVMLKYSNNTPGTGYVDFGSTAGAGGTVEFTGGNTTISRIFASGTAKGTEENFVKVRLNKILNTNTLTIQNTRNNNNGINYPIKVRGATSSATTFTPGGNLDFTSGVIIEATANDFILFTDNATAQNMSNNSYVGGAVQKTGDDAFTFPVGQFGRYRGLAISAPAIVTDAFTAQYFTNDPTVAYGTNMVAGLVGVSSCEYWTLARTAGTSAVSVKLSFNSPDCPDYNITNLNDLVVAEWDGTQWTNEGNSATTGNTMNGTVTSLGTVANYISYTLGSISSTSVLPVELFSFEGNQNGVYSSELIFKTASELNNNHFEIQKCTNPGTLKFDSIGVVAGKGSTNELTTYQFIDNEFFSTSYYRLKQVDNDGIANGYSEVIRVQRDGPGGATLVIAPNPFTSSIKFWIDDGTGDDDNLSLNIINSIGKTERTYYGNRQKIIEDMNADLATFESGFYIFKISTSKGSYSCRAVKN